MESAGFDERAARNLHACLEDQAAATGAVPDDRTVVVERFRDEVGAARRAAGPGGTVEVHGRRPGPTGTRSARRDGEGQERGQYLGGERHDDYNPGKQRPVVLHSHLQHQPVVPWQSDSRVVVDLLVKSIPV